MKKVEYILSCVAVSLFFIHSVYTESVTVSDTSYPTCKTYYLSSLNPDLDIYYYGAELDGECLIKVDGGINKLCVTAKTFEISNSCQVKVKYFGGYYYSSLSPDKTYDCILDSPLKWCPYKSDIAISISKSGWGNDRGNNIHLKVTRTSDTDSDFSDIADIAGNVVKVTYIIIGCVIGGIVLISIITVVIVCCVCNKRRNTRGQVFRNAQQAPNQVPIGAYPTSTTTPYPQTGACPQAGAYPQAGYQPAAQTGYPGYQPQPQTAPDTDYKPASAPPAEPLQPPPYPGY